MLHWKVREKQYLKALEQAHQNVSHSIFEGLI